MLSQKMEKIFVCLPLLCGIKAAYLTISGLHKIELLHILRDLDIAYRSLDMNHMIEEIMHAHQIWFGEILWESFQALNSSEVLYQSKIIGNILFH